MKHYETYHRVALSKRIRWKLGLSQDQFAIAYHIPIDTLRDWERYRSEPDAEMLAMLQSVADSLAIPNIEEGE